MPAAGRVRIADIARAAGVSVPTVSKVLNGRAEVAAETRDRVQALLDEHNYQRRGAGIARAGLIDFVVNELDSPWAVELIRGAEEAAHSAGVGLVVSAIHGRRSDARKWLDGLVARRSDGVVLVVSELPRADQQRLAELDVPLVLVDPFGSADPTIPAIGATNWAGGLAATEHLTGLGHRRIGVITGPRRLLCSQARLDGYRAALERVGVPADPALIKYGDFHHPSGRAAALELLELEDPPTAIFAGSDQQAFGVYEALRARGLRVPHDISVVGFDDLSICDWVSPPLTTIRQPLEEMAAMATRMLLESSGYDHAQARHVELATSLVVRESTAAPVDRAERAGGDQS
ncbi:MAG TPA: LacI family DNA-binding transcriptional regulator [Jatrophihabitantaceae bacterium]|nr:LacI family DNA-binding transcriptional regulator [Jatrophihabitantaceae bacterium]